MKKILCFISLCLLFTSVSYANNYSSSINKLKENDKNIVIRVNDFLKNLNSFKSNFIQQDNITSIMAEGVFYLSKPMKARFEYTMPNKLLIVLNGSIIHYYDIELDEITTIARKTIPVLDFLSKQQNLEDTDSKILSVKQIKNKYYIKTEIKIDKNETAEITYIFDKTIENLMGLNYRTVDNQVDIEMSFVNPQVNIQLNKKLFIFQNPRLNSKKK